jgi:hypothetical protein
MIFREVLSDRFSFVRDKREAMAIFVNLHVIANANPSPVRGLFDTVRIEATRTKRPTQFTHVPCPITIEFVTAASGCVAVPDFPCRF